MNNKNELEQEIEVIEEKQEMEVSLDAQEGENSQEAQQTVNITFEPLKREEVAQLFNDEELKAFLYSIKCRAVSLRADDINGAVEDFVKLTLGAVDVSSMPQDVFDALMNIKVSGIEELKDTYDVINIGKEFYNLLNTAERNNISVESVRKRTENLYRRGVIDDEQMAMGYHNVALLFESLDKSNGYYSKGRDYNVFTNKYMVKALNLTSSIELIQTCLNYIPEKTKNMREMVQDALDRAFKKNGNDASSMFQICMLYAESFEKYGCVPVGFEERNVEKDGNYHSIIYYKEALKYAPTVNDEIRTLRRIAKKQNKKDIKGYIDTRLSIIKISSGKLKVMEMLRLANNEGVDDKLKMKLYEGAVNELIEDKFMPKGEKNLLWKNIKANLSDLYGNNSRKIARLQAISDKYFPEVKTKKKVGFSKKSSTGKDYFSR